MKAIFKEEKKLNFDFACDTCVLVLDWKKD